MLRGSKYILQICILLWIFESAIGHSLGAALAQVAALDIFVNATMLNSSGYRFVQTFGSPRWCNDVLVNYFEQIIDVHWRLVNLYDVGLEKKEDKKNHCGTLFAKLATVPTVPPQDKYYHHTPTMVWYKDDSPLTYTICDESGEDPACEYVGYSIYDHLHYMGLYEDCT
ncbi:hypothetical protein RFI_19781 [Reticulomyxa filosa]|uniref:Fungal lipase-type domain-containing protein n=1 Tax=Reticulomyxa filosa TaxID=46433 RepID=X6MU78_RETFI|nr:hypothetical protein RFI_19781 [Reticulomyxa filosa]|eukprot:ETO17538.1 hypothetical protein RFI_19781 [Reticulomyxa filosa]